MSPQASALIVKNEYPKGTLLIPLTDMEPMLNYFLALANAFAPPILALLLVGVGFYFIKKGRKTSSSSGVDRAGDVHRKRRQKRAFARGAQFEKNLYNRIANALPAEGVIFDDILIEDERGTTQIDIIVILPTAFLVIEAKQYSGLILGNQHDRVWTQILKRGAIKNTFQNPFRQNHRHLKALESVTGLPIERMTSMIVFGGRCQFGDNAVPQGVFLNSDDAIDHINHYRGFPPMFSYDEMEALCGKIALAKQAGSSAKHRHVETLRQKKRVQD
ncbi:nuclease-related domain-containing protein [Photobacterium damselae]|uniref:nuclease-related domain-containing protein n=1 Tax=Photobacterium damselae TaxID=38293 RepID=UPI0030F47890